MSGVSPDPSGITDEMIEQGAQALYAESRDPFSRPWEELATADQDLFRRHTKYVLAGALAGRTVVDLPEPTAWRNRMDGDVDIWPVGGWSVTTSPSGVEICTSRNGLGGGGLTFRAEQAREFGVAILAADARLAARQSSGVSGGGAHHD
jgi:hypothetical protein